MKLLGTIVALALIAHPASAEITWKYCNKYMEGWGPNALHVVAYRTPTPFPLARVEQEWIKKIGARCEPLWIQGITACKKQEDVAPLITVHVFLEGESFQGDCPTGTMHAVAATEIIELPPH